MSNNPNIDETIVLDYSVFRHHLVTHLRSDGVFCVRDASLVQQFDTTLQAHSRITKCRMALESVLKNGITRRSRKAANEAGIAFIRQEDAVSNVVQLPIQIEKRRSHGNGNDAA